MKHITTTLYNQNITELDEIVEWYQANGWENCNRSAVIRTAICDLHSNVFNNIKSAEE